MPTPVPRDIPLPLPAGSLFLELLLVLAFIAHILFVNLMVGGALLVFAFELRGLREPAYDRLARALATVVTVNKSLAVVLGVAPLLVINVLYTVHFYTANALTGTAWILLVPAIAATFLLLYLHKYTWDRLAASKLLHLSLVALAALLLLLIPLVFLANVNLMMFPEKWTGVRGFFSALTLPNVFPRYFHFLCASIIVTSLFGVHYFGRAGFQAADELGGLTPPRVRRAFYEIAFVTSLAQFVVGPLVLFTLPSKGLGTEVVLTILIGALIAIPAVWLMWKELGEPEPAGRRLPRIATYLSLTVLCMALGRHLYRFTALAEHRAQIRQVTEQWVRDSEQAAYDARSGRGASTSKNEGERLFQDTCSGCHGLARRVVGPPLTEISTIYANDALGIVRWARAPGKKRPDSPQMPAFAALGDAKLRAIAEYMLASGSAARQ